jgi:hypothetical protein
MTAAAQGLSGLYAWRSTDVRNPHRFPHRRGALDGDGDPQDGETVVNVWRRLASLAQVAEEADMMVRPPASRQVAA